MRFVSFHTYGCLNRGGSDLKRGTKNRGLISSAERDWTEGSFRHHPSLSVSCIMLKRQASGPTKVRKRKKGNATYSMGSLDPSEDERMVVEDVRMWDISTSKTTGRVTANRRTLKHYSQGGSVGREPREIEEVANMEDTGILADSESPPESDEKKRVKRKRVRVAKENDSVGGSLASSPLRLTRVFRQGWSSGSSPVRWS